MKPCYRKTSKGTWAVMGPVEEITVGATVTVFKKDGTTNLELIESLGKPFVVDDGTQCVYGYPAPREEPVKPAEQERCMECGQRPGVQECRDQNGIPGICCRQCAAMDPWERSFG